MSLTEPKCKRLFLTLLLYTALVEFFFFFLGTGIFWGKRDKSWPLAIFWTFYAGGILLHPLKLNCLYHVLPEMKEIQFIFAIFLCEVYICGTVWKFFHSKLQGLLDVSHHWCRSSDETGFFFSFVKAFLFFFYLCIFYIAVKPKWLLNTKSTVLIKTSFIKYGV